MLQTITIDELNILSPVFSKGNKEYNALVTNLCRNRNSSKKVWQSYEHPDNKRKVLIIYNTIPQEFKSKYGLPVDFKEAKRLIKERNAAIEAQTKDVAALPANKNILRELDRQRDSNSGKYMPLYSTYCKKDLAATTKLAKEHALRVAVVEYKDVAGVKIKQLHQAYLQLSQAGTQNNYYKFSSVIKHQWTTEQGISLTHGHAGREREDLKKLTDTHLAIIEELYKHSNQWSHNHITEQLNKYCKANGLPEVSRRTVGNHLQQSEVYNRLLSIRNKEAFNKKVAPFSRRTGALNAGDLYYMDGSPTQIPCWNNDRTKVIRHTLFVVLDSYSRKIVGFHIAETEDRFTWLSAMKMAFSMAGALPAEIVYDNGSATTSAEFIQLKDKVKLMGCNMRAALPGEPTAKAQVERWFGSFQSQYERMIEGFVGEGIRSKRETGRIDAEFLKKVHKDNGYLTYDSLVETLSILVNAYNQKSTPKKAAPSVKFADNEKPNMRAVASDQLAFLFWKNREIKVSRSEVKIAVRNVPYYYGITDFNMQMQLNGQTVKVYYDECDMSSVHLFDLHDEPLCEVRQKFMFHEAQVNQTQTDVNNIMGQSSHKKAFERKLKADSRAKTATAQAALGDSLSKLLNPLEMLKEDYNNAETEQLMDYIRQEHRVNPLNVDTYKPVTDNLPVEKRYAKKHLPKKELELVVVGSMQ
ncbi:hypothetical protein CJD36_008195 [Flavipsychrobacter stenotrophus]|uniref:Integrase catalytic domain-containing protein n=1 Tax=Flavipsychrobacter stenotrophus TaxID=2077091 RepID=A0A2S7SYW1_9BACT|nr:DDE-type integrase/transposase/recombinase [Flavipsychrobacter stenotrophus]PQJ11765.1 hypothetical protein CJD36_008195 [Flavipsychrobacter stenotrophus]